MPPDRPNISDLDVDRLEHILEASSDLVRFVQDRRRDELDKDPMLRRAILHAVLVIGEAASRVSPQTRSLLPQLEWSKIVATRNILVHVYWGVDYDTIWRVATERAPELVEAVQPLLMDREDR